MYLNNLEKNAYHWYTVDNIHNAVPIRLKAEGVTP